MRNILGFFLITIGLSSFGQDFHKCYTHEALLEQETLSPGYIGHVNEVFERAKYAESQDRAELYRIPVVVHIVYNTDEENLPDSVIFNQIETLNADYRRLNEDADNVRDTFNTIVGDTFIGFELAAFDPDGNPTNGITRTNTDVESFLSFAGLSPAEGVKSSADGGIDPWDQDRYLNIWVCDMSFLGEVFLLGYATPPDGLDHWPEDTGLGDGVVVQYQAFGRNNPNPLFAGGDEIDVRGRTTTHEVGHYLGLRHIWGDGDCTEQDGIDDTPNAEEQSAQDCDFDKNTCVDDIGALGDLPDMVENYMDYSAETCQNSFTLGQVEMMRGILEINRTDLITDNPALGLSKLVNAEAKFEIYPNPSNGQVFLSVDGLNQSNRIEIFAETGQLIQSFWLEEGVNTIEIQALSKGIYIVHVSNLEATAARKLVVY